MQIFFFKKRSFEYENHFADEKKTQKNFVVAIFCRRHQKNAIPKQL